MGRLEWCPKASSFCLDAILAGTTCQPMKTNRPASACQHIRDFDEDFSGFLTQSPECVFTHGACHAFALELRDLLKRQGASETKLCMIRNSPLPLCEDVQPEQPIAKHVFVLSSSHGIDINGIQPLGRILKDRGTATDDVSEEVEYEEWLTEPSSSKRTQSVVDLRADSSFLSEARKLALRVIFENPAKFGLACAFAPSGPSGSVDGARAKILPNTE